MPRYLTALALLAALTLGGCQPHTIVYVPPVGIAHTPDLNGAVLLECDAGQATAAVVAYVDGWYYAATAKHVTDAATWLRVDDAWAEVFATSGRRDVALIRWKSARTYTVYPLARAELGQECWAVGHPHTGVVVNRGWISRVGAKAVWHNAGGTYGYSGGPLLSAKGEILGIVSTFMVLRDWSWPIPIRQVWNSMGQAVPSSEIHWLMCTIPQGD